MNIGFSNTSAKEVWGVQYLISDIGSSGLVRAASRFLLEVPQAFRSSALPVPYLYPARSLFFLSGKFIFCSRLGCSHFIWLQKVWLQKLIRAERLYNVRIQTYLESISYQKKSSVLTLRPPGGVYYHWWPLVIPIAIRTTRQRRKFEGWACGRS